MVGIDKRLDRIHHVFNLDVSDFGGAHALFNSVPQGFFALSRRVVIVILFTVGGHVTRIFNGHVAFQCAIVQQPKFCIAFCVRLLRR